tara:strand:- start:976 stop:1749 length:774 start_codon:yes stop_codon:yes gene_type:complete
MIYLKTYMYAPHELEFIIANLEECYDHIEKMIVCEFDINHTGVKRNFQFQNLEDKVPEHLRDKIDYHACEVFNETARAYENEDAIHNVNEPVMRSYFTKLYDFNDDDIIISIDADEIIYGDKIAYIISEVQKHKVVALKLRQFFYKKTYLWKNKDFTSPIATYYGSISKKYPYNWRDIGRVTDQYVGCHFSWCMTPKEMIHKLDTYSHPRYRFCSDEKLLEDAIENKKYPFDNGTQFDIRELDPNDQIIPHSLRVDL